MKKVMKLKWAMVIMVLSMVSYDGSAQVELGVKAGLNFNSTSVDAASSGTATVSDVANTRTGYHFGAYAKLKLGPIALQPEAYYSVQGADVTIAGASGAVNSNYLQVPILIRYDFLKMFNVHVGPQFGLVLKNELDLNGTVDDIEDASRAGDFSVAAGVGVDLPFKLNVTLRYVQGLTDVIDDASSAGGVESMTNAMIQLSVGYALIKK